MCEFVHVCVHKVPKERGLCTNISVLFPTDGELPNKAPIEIGPTLSELCKAPTERGL